MASRTTTLRGPDAATAIDDSTPDRLLDAAERIFAEQGIEAASVRAITTAADANIAAVHYHFGSKLDLVRALVERRVAEVQQLRLPLLDAAEARDQVGPIDVASAWVQPLATLTFDPSGTRRSYVAFLAVLQSGGPELRALGESVFRPQQQRFAVLLERALPHVDEPVRWFRFAMAADAAIRALADVERAARPWRSAGSSIDNDTLVDHIIDAIAGLLTGPTKSRPT